MRSYFPAWFSYAHFTCYFHDVLQRYNKKAHSSKFETMRCCLRHRCAKKGCVVAVKNITQ